MYVTQDSLGGKMVSLANELFAKHEKNKSMFCVVEFDLDENKMASYSSGHGDAEEKFCNDFPNLVHQFGAPKTVMMITKANPCRRVCTPELLKMFAHNPGIEHFYIYFYERYLGENLGKAVNVMDELNTTIHHPNGTASKLYCQPLRGDAKSGLALNRHHYAQKDVSDITKEVVKKYFN